MHGVFCLQGIFSYGKQSPRCFIIGKTETQVFGINFLHIFPQDVRLSNASLTKGGITSSH